MYNTGRGLLWSGKEGSACAVGHRDMSKERTMNVSQSLPEEWPYKISIASPTLSRNGRSDEDEIETGPNWKDLVLRDREVKE